MPHIKSHLSRCVFIDQAGGFRIGEAPPISVSIYRGLGAPDFFSQRPLTVFFLRKKCCKGVSIAAHDRHIYRNGIP